MACDPDLSLSACRDYLHEQEYFEWWIIPLSIGLALLVWIASEWIEWWQRKRRDARLAHPTH